MGEEEWGGKGRGREEWGRGGKGQGEGTIPSKRNLKNTIKLLIHFYC